MRVSREKVAENRERILDVAAASFCERGFDGISVADIMRGAGLTHGGFYGHFDSKDALAAEASRSALGRSAKKWAKLAQNNPDRALQSVIESYLSKRHRDNAANGCVLAALASEASRQEKAVQLSFAEGLELLVDALTPVVSGRSKAARRRKAMSALSEMVGALALARAVRCTDLSDEILAASSSHLLSKQD